MQHGTKTVMNTRQRKGPTSFKSFSRNRPSKTDRLAAPAPQNAQRSYERYISLARAAASSGDLVEMENYYQYAEHYLRSMGEHAAR